MRQTPIVVYCAVDPFIPLRGKIHRGFEEFSIALEHASTPLVWVTWRTRLQVDEPRRTVAHNHPFIGEGGSGVYLPEDYFHLRPPKTIRLGRFTCIPIAEPQPAASEALELLSEELGVPVVPLRSLSPRELAQNSGLPAREAELTRQRDFDEPFFFAGASDADIKRFTEEAVRRKVNLRQHGVLWSLAVGASLNRCLREVSKLYDRALRYHPTTVGVATPDEAHELFTFCDRAILLNDRTASDSERAPALATKYREFHLSMPDAWEQALTSLLARA